MQSHKEIESRTTHSISTKKIMLNTHVPSLFRGDFPKAPPPGSIVGDNIRIGSLLGDSPSGFLFLTFFLELVLSHWVFKQDLASLDATRIQL